MSRNTLIFIFLLMGCSHTVPDYTIEGAAVKTSQQESALTSCERVGPIKERYAGGTFDRNNLIVMRKLYNKAGLSKITHLANIKLHDVGNHCGRNCVEVTAVAYRCNLHDVSLSSIP